MADLTLSLTETLHLLDTVRVPTRLYFPSGTLTPDVSPTADAAWNNTASAAVRKLVVGGAKKGTAAASVTVTGTAANPEKMLHAQYVSVPMLAQTLSGSVRGQFRCLESATGANATIQIGIRVVSQDGATVRATLLAVGGTTTTATTPPEFASSLTNRRLLTSGDATPLALTDYTCVTGDRLVIEIGHNNKSVSTSQTHGISFGDNTGDLPEDDATTTALDPWIEFNFPIAFATQVENVKVSDSGTIQLFSPPQLHISDGPVTAQLVDFAGLSRDVGTESVKLTDTVTTVLDPLVPALSSEGLHVTDSLTVVENPLVPILSSEGLRVDDSTLLLEGGALTAAPTAEAVTLLDTGALEWHGVVHCVEQPITTLMTTQVPLTSEGVHVTETLTLLLTPLQTSLTEAPHPVDQAVSYALNPPSSGFTYSGTEAAKVSDQGRLDLIGRIHCDDGSDFHVALDAFTSLAVNTTETVHVTDVGPAVELPHLDLVLSETALIGETGLGQYTDLEACTILDTILDVQLGPIQVLPLVVTSEAVLVSDSLTITRDLVAVVSETAHVADTPIAAFTNPGDALVVNVSETIVASESVTPVLTPLRTSLTDGVLVSDAITPVLDPLVAAPSETVLVSDTGVTITYPSQLVFTETAHIQDSTLIVRLDPLVVDQQESVAVADTLLHLTVGGTFVRRPRHWHTGGRSPKR